MKHQHHPLKTCEKRFGSKYQLLRHIKSEHTNYSLLNVNYYIISIYTIYTICNIRYTYNIQTGKSRNNNNNNNNNKRALTSIPTLTSPTPSKKEEEQ